MKRIVSCALLAGALMACAAGCGGNSGGVARMSEKDGGDLANRMFRERSGAMKGGAGSGAGTAAEGTKTVNTPGAPGGPSMPGR